MDRRTIAERTTTSRYFTWVEEYQGGAWTGLRNATVVFEIKASAIRYEDSDHYDVISRLPGQANFAMGSYSLQTAQEMADQRFDEWMSTMGLVTK